LDLDAIDDNSHAADEQVTITMAKSSPQIESRSKETNNIITVDSMTTTTDAVNNHATTIDDLTTATNPGTLEIDTLPTRLGQIWLWCRFGFWQ